MFGKLKDAAQNGAVQKLVDMAAPGLKDKLLEIIQQVSPATVSHDESFVEKVVNPLKLSVAVSAGGATSLIPGFDAKFQVAMFHLRDELLEVTDSKVALVEGFDKKLPEVLKSGLQKAKQAA
jgi:hypothetical protein